MKIVLYSGLLLLLSATSLAEPEKSPRRRRRIIVYDQSTQLIQPQTSVSPDARAEADRRARLERESAQSLFGSGNSDALPTSLNLAPLAPTTSTAEPEEEEEDWIKVEDILTEEELMDFEVDSTEEEAPVEMEIVDWDSLQQQLIEDEMSGQTEEQAELLEQEEEEMLAEMTGRETDRTRGGLEEREAAGLGLESVLDASEDRVLERGAAEGQRVESSRSMQETAPVLQPVFLAGERGVPTIGNPEASVSEEFSGSQELLKNLQTKWNAQNSPRAPSMSTSRAPIPAASLRNPFESSALNRSSVAQPAPVSRQDPFTSASIRTSSSGPRDIPSASSRPSQAPPNSVRPEPRERIRSQLGAGY